MKFIIRGMIQVQLRTGSTIIQKQKPYSSGSKLIPSDFRRNVAALRRHIIPREVSFIAIQSGVYISCKAYARQIVYRE